MANEVEKIAAGEIKIKYPSIDWKFIPPGAPHMGGAWERMIRSIKSTAMDILPSIGIRAEILRATFADIKNI